MPPWGTWPGQPPGGPQVLPPTRLSPRVLLIDPVRTLKSLFVPLVGVLFVGGFSPRSFLWAGLGIVITVVYTSLRWATFTYQVVGDRLELNRALIGRSIRTIPLDRIRGVDISTPPLHRLLGLAVLRVDTGASGAGAQEGELNALTIGQAERVRALLLQRAAATQAAEGVAADARVEAGAAGAGPEAGAASPGAVGPDRSAEPEQVLARVPRSWLKYGPLSGAYLLTPFALLAGAIGLVFQAGQELGISASTARSIGEWILERPYLLVGAAVVLVLAMPLVGGVMYAIFHWDFTLRRRGDFLVAERGLITRRSVSLEHQRVRGYEVLDGIGERPAGVVRLRAIVTGLGDSSSRGQLLPATPRPYALDTMAQAIWPFTLPLERHPPAALRRRLFRAIAPWALVAVIAFAVGWLIVAFAAVALALLGIPLGLDRYRSLGHTFDGEHLAVRSGSLRRTQANLEGRAVVGWTIRQTLFQRQAGVMTVIAGVGAGSGGYSAIDVGESQGVDFAAKVTPAWIEPFRTSSPPPPNDKG
ncbi:PH domain-containing protein [Thermopolyspora sp. NPDC052614]|uniref:PH domain-containing protein n=1 Tax=Thermopolyspora sp. NPDC052614 TaxID=3155682 RepID=UPI0034376189